MWIHGIAQGDPFLNLTETGINECVMKEQAQLGPIARAETLAVHKAMIRISLWCLRLPLNMLLLFQQFQCNRQGL
jgi:hypothetical protein